MRHETADWGEKHSGVTLQTWKTKYDKNHKSEYYKNIQREITYNLICTKLWQCRRKYLKMDIWISYNNSRLYSKLSNKTAKSGGWLWIIPEKHVMFHLNLAFGFIASQSPEALIPDDIYNSTCRVMDLMVSFPKMVM